MRNFAPAAIAVLAATLLQAMFAPYLAIGKATPNFLLLVVITLALVQGPTSGASAGFIAGLLFDLLGTGAVGPMALVLTITGYLAGMLHEQMFAEGWLAPLVALAVASLVAEVAYGALLGVLGEGGPFFSAFITKMFPRVLYNIVLALLVYPLLARLLKDDHPVTQFKRLM
ncbi:MAG: rod shape-determining protein MreD [Coriobacteriia bacterium]|nr:rod shape-determining protein MreD [Coriobacteriia bacterium]